MHFCTKPWFRIWKMLAPVPSTPSREWPTIDKAFILTENERKETEHMRNNSGLSEVKAIWPHNCDLDIQDSLTNESMHDGGFFNLVSRGSLRTCHSYVILLFVSSFPKHWSRTNWIPGIILGKGYNFRAREDMIPAHSCTQRWTYAGNFSKV